MPAKDRYHDHVRNALIRDGWQITHDPYRLQWGPKDLFIDLGAEHLLAAELGNRKIAVEIKSFTNPSAVNDLENALGQFILYQDILEHIDPERVLYLAIRRTVYLDIFTEPIGEVLLDNKRLRLIVFDPANEVIEQWIS